MLESRKILHKKNRWLHDFADSKSVNGILGGLFHVGPGVGRLKLYSMQGCFGVLQITSLTGLRGQDSQGGVF